VSTPGYIRTREWRRRVLNNVVILRVEVPLEAMVETLECGGHLAESEMDDLDAVQAALQRAIEIWIGVDD
jgi:hypothetical protein